MTRKTSRDPAGPATPPEPARRGALRPSAPPVADVQGNPARVDDSASTLAGPDAPVPTGSHTTAGAGRKQPGPVVAGKTAAGPGDQPEPEALSGKAFRAAFKAARSAKAKTQRQQRARPWTKRDPLRNAVPGGKKDPP